MPSYGYHVTTTRALPFILKEGLKAGRVSDERSLHYDNEFLHSQPRGVYMTNDSQWCADWVTIYHGDELGPLAVVVVDITGLRTHPDHFGSGCRYHHKDIGPERIVGHTLIKAPIAEPGQSEKEVDELLIAQVDTFLASHPSSGRAWL